MFEITISTAKAKSKDISFIIGKLRRDFAEMKGIIVCEDFNGRVNLALAVKKEKKDLALSLIFDAVCEAIIRGYKEDVLFENINIKTINKITKSTFVKALTMFDKKTDRQIIKSVLKPSKEIAIDSLFMFQLWALKKRWVEIAELINDNSNYLLMSGAFVELMKFLILTNECEFGDVHVFYQNGNIIGKGEDGTEVFNMKYNEEESDNIKVISEIISLAPQKIILHKELISLEIKKLLTTLFEGKISVLK